MVFLGRYEALVIIVFFSLFPLCKGMRLNLTEYSWKRELKLPQTFAWAIVIGFVIGCRIERMEPLRSLWLNRGATHGFLLFLVTVGLGVTLATCLRLSVIWFGAFLRTKVTGNKNLSELQR